MNPKTSSDLFNKIRSQFSNIQIGDESGIPTADPTKAVFFEFEFKEDADTYGAVSVSLADGENMKVFYNRNLVDKIDEDSRDEWYAFLKELKDFSVEHQLAFDVRDITKSNLTKQDYKNLADTNTTVNTDEMSEELNRITKLAGVEVKEGLTGTARRSYEDLEKTRLIVRHSGKVDEEIPGSRSRHIESLYIENEDGERFKYPLTHLAGARAMQRHVANGGRPHDEFGEHIVKTSEDIAKLNSFSRYVSHKDQLNDNAGDIIEQTKLQLENLREYIRNISKQPHYEAASKDFKTAEDQILDDETIAKLREKFTLKNLDNRVEDALPLINRIMSELEAPKEEAPVTEDSNRDDLEKAYMLAVRHHEGPGEDEGTGDGNYSEDVGDLLMDYYEKTGQKPDHEQIERIYNKIDDKKEHYADILQAEGINGKIWLELAKKHYGGELGMKIDEPITYPESENVTELDPGEEPIDAPVEPAVDHAMVVKQFLANPDSKILLNKNMPDEKKYDAPKASPEDAIIMTTLSDIASRMLTKTPDEDRVANFASRVADQMSKTGEPFDPEDPDAKTNRDIAKALVAKYEKVAQEIDPAEFKAKKDIKGKPIETAEFEDWVNETVAPFEPATQESQPDPDAEKADAARGMWASSKEIQAQYKTWQDFLNSEEFDDYLDDEFRNQLEGLTFEDIKPYVSMYKGDDGKIVHDVLDKDEKSVYKTNNAKDAMNYLSKNFNKLRGDAPKVSDFVKDESLKESRTKIVEAIKAKVDGHAQDIAGVEGEIERITQLANYQN